MIVTSLLTIAVIAALTAYSVILLFLISGLFRSVPLAVPSQPYVSVVVAAHNEAPVIEKCLQALVNQSYPSGRTEIIVVNDRSTDATEEILSKYAHRYPHLRYLTVAPGQVHVSPKKYALTQGISAAGGEIILTTDADCEPGPDWIRGLIDTFSRDTGCVIGFAPLENDGSLLGRLLSLEALANALVSAGSSGWNHPVTATGRNLAYRKSVFAELYGFSNHAHSLSGDDDLLVQGIASTPGWQVRFAWDKSTVVISRTAATMKQFFFQRLRHVSAAKHYTTAIQTGYLIFNISNVILWLAPLPVLVYGAYGTGFWLALLGKITLDLIGLAVIAARFDRWRDLIIFPLWELWYLVSTVSLNPIGLILKPRWK